MIRVGATVLLVAALSSSAAAETDDRVAVEVLHGETPRDAALAFERACFRLGLPTVEASPVQLFSHRGRSYVRLAVSGPALVTRCVSALEPGRSGVTGIVHWLDGFSGGLVVNGPSSQEDRVPDTEWFGAGPKLVQPPVDGKLIEDLLHGGSAGIDRLLQLDQDSALVQVRTLRARGGPEVVAALEIIAEKDTYWSVRRTAVEGLAGGVSALASLRALMRIAKTDPAPEVREAAVIVLQSFANTGGLAAGAPADEAGDVLLDVLAHDPSWIVRRRVIWSLTRELVDRDRPVLQRLVTTDPEPQVRAAAMTALVGMEILSHAEVSAAMHDHSPEVRAVAASALAAQMDEGDAPALWAALNDPDRQVRLAAVGFVTRITDASIGPRLWQLYLSESAELDADPAFERAVLDELVRAPFPDLSHRIQIALLSKSLSPDERRVLARVFSRVDPAKAESVLEPGLTNPDPLVRSLAADAAPATPGIQARRLALLADDNADVRAAAVLGLCRAPHIDSTALLAAQAVEFGTTSLSREAILTLAHCGQTEPVQYFETTLEVAPTAPVTSDGATLPAVLAMVLMMASVFVAKLGG